MFVVFILCHFNPGDSFGCNNIVITSYYSTSIQQNCSHKLLCGDKKMNQTTVKCTKMALDLFKTNK